MVLVARPDSILRSEGGGQLTGCDYPLRVPSSLAADRAYRSHQDDPLLADEKEDTAVRRFHHRVMDGAANDGNSR